MAGRILAIGDVHGCHRALVTLLGVLAPSSNDTVVFLGDAVDRGPSSRQVVDEILTLRESCKVLGWVCLDTFPYGGKWLSCLDVESDLVFQTSEDGDTREFPLSKYT